MSQEMIEQARLFLSFAATGVMLGAIFDVFRVIRRTAKNRAVTNICDACFWLFGGAYFISCFYRVAGANLRIYIYLAVASGAAALFSFAEPIFCRGRLCHLENHYKNSRGNCQNSGRSGALFP